MMPLPGFQKPMPYLAAELDRKSYTSLLLVLACAKSATPPNFPPLRSAGAIIVCWQHAGTRQRGQVGCGDIARAQQGTGGCPRSCRWVVPAPVLLCCGGALDEVVAVDGGGHRRLGQARGD